VIPYAIASYFTELLWYFTGLQVGGVRIMPWFHVQLLEKLQLLQRVDAIIATSLTDAVAMYSVVTAPL